MTDREKVVRAVETCFDSWIDKHRNMGLDLHEVERMKREALELLKEQEAIKPKIEKAKISLMFEGDCTVTLAQCGKCGMPIEQPIDEESHGWKYCPNCGKRVKWDDA